jgi:hypothetical protein
MIETPTVFILGAGASASYGYPCGDVFIEKLYKCIQGLRVPNRLTALEQQYWNELHGTPQGPSAAYYEEFAKAIKDSGFASIDAFLNAHEKNPQYVALGKGAIAKVLMDAEHTAMTLGVPENDDWMKYLLRKLTAGTRTPEEFIEGNKVSFITFNYDCLLERRLYSGVQASYSLSDAKARELIQTHFPVRHIYGSLKTFPQKANVTDTSKITDWYESAQAIKTVYDAEHRELASFVPKKRIEEAERICFLGFGFHELNMEVLGLTGKLNPRKLAATSRFELTDAEWGPIDRRYPGIEFQALPIDHKCLDTLRNIQLS